MGNTESFGAAFGALVKERRSAKGWSLAELAAQVFEANKNDPTFEGRKGDISKLENGNTSNPRARTVQKYARALGISQSEIDVLRGIAPDPQAERIAQLEAQISKTEQTPQVSHAAILRLVRPIAEEIEDPHEALLALQEAVQIAVRVQQEGRHGSNLGDFVDEVLRRTSALAAEGAYETAIAELDDALAREEAESQARTLRLLKAAIDQHLLSFDADGAAAKITRRVALETDPAALFAALREEWIAWYERGRDKGLRLDLEVSIVLARIAETHAADADQRGAALNNLANALWTLGQRETGTDRLDQAVDAYRAALQERTRERVPLDWAMTQNNLGNALQTLGQRETGTDRLEQAVDAYRAALLEWTRERVPLDWAMTQNNLGSALRTLGQRETGTGRLEEAVDASRAALQEWTRERVPFLWAQTRENLALAHRALFEKTGDRAELERARVAVAEALKVYHEARAAFYIDKATHLRDGLAAL